MNKPNKTILFLHGALGTVYDMKDLMGLLLERGYKTLSFDFPGHGLQTKWPEEFRIDLFARELEAFITKNELTDVTVFGYAMGGYVALYHKANYPDSPVSKIITYGTKFNWSENAISRELPKLNPAHLTEKFPQYAQALKEKHGDRWKSLLLSTAHLVQHLEKIDGLTREDLIDVQIPVTFILGDQDKIVTSEETHLTASWLHYGHVKTLTHSKHELERSNLKELSILISDAID